MKVRSKTDGRAIDTETGRRYVSQETRAKLSQAAKRRWALRNDTATAVAAAAEQVSLPRLYQAAYALKEDQDGLKEVITDGVTGETLVNALDTETSAGTSLQTNLRSRLVEYIVDALRA